MVSAGQYRSGKNNVTVQIKARGKTHGKCDEKGRDMRTNRSQRSIENLLFKDKIIADKINEDIEQGVKPTASQVTKSLWRNKFPERRIKKINN